MNRRFLFITLGLLLLVNIVVLIGVARNRSGAPDSTLTLTERELPLSWHFRDQENTGVSLQLNINFDNEEQQWFDENKLVELGFDIPQDRQQGQGNRKRVLPKKAYVVLEYDGDAWHRYRQRQLDEVAAIPLEVEQGKVESEDAESQVKEKRFQLTIASRLFGIDVGLDPDVLRTRYPDNTRYIIVPATVRMHVDWHPESADAQGAKSVSGRIERVLVQQFHVSRNLSRALDTLPEYAGIRAGYTLQRGKSGAQSIPGTRCFRAAVGTLDIGD